MNLPQDVQPKLGDLSSMILPLLLKQKMAERQKKGQTEERTRQSLIDAIISGEGTFGPEAPGTGLTGGAGTAATYAEQMAGRGKPFDINQLVLGGDIPDLSRWQATPAAPTVSASVSPYSFKEKLQAQNILGATPESLAGVEGYEGLTKRAGGLFGMGYGPGSRHEYRDPESKGLIGKMQTEARDVLEGPGKISYRQTGKFNGKPFFDLTKQKNGSFGGKQKAEEADPETQALIDEYNTTDDPERIKELEKLLRSRGVEFE